MSLRTPKRILSASVALLTGLIVLRFILVTTARYAPGPVAGGARTLGHWADPGNV